jgi:hypothetical protein
VFKVMYNPYKNPKTVMLWEGTPVIMKPESYPTLTKDSFKSEEEAIAFIKSNGNKDWPHYEGSAEYWVEQEEN